MSFILFLQLQCEMYCGSLKSLYLRKPTSFECVLLPTTFSSLLSHCVANERFLSSYICGFIVFFPVFSNSDWRVDGFYKAGLAWVIRAVDGRAICPYFTVLV